MTALVWGALLAAVVVGWTLRARAIRCRHRDRDEGLSCAALYWEHATHRARAERDVARAGRDHLAWELDQAKRVARIHVAALTADRDDWRTIARGWQDRAVTHMERPTVVVAVEGEAAVRAAVAGLDEQLAGILEAGQQ